MYMYEYYIGVGGMKVWVIVIINIIRMGGGGGGGGREGGVYVLEYISGWLNKSLCDI